MAQPLVNQIIRSGDRFQFDSNEDRDLHNQVNFDCEDMDNYARPARNDARAAIQGYMAIALGGSSDGRSKLFVPKIHAITYARMAMEAASIPSVEYKAVRESSRQKIRFINAAKDNAEDGDGNLRPDSQNLWFYQNFDKILLGTGFRFLTYLYQERLVRVKDENGKEVEKKMVVYDDVWDEVPNFFHVGVSRDMQPGMFGGRACYYDKFFPLDHFMERFNNNLYKNVKLAAAQTDWFDNETGVRWDVPEKWVRVRFGWDLFKDLYYVQANGIPIRKDYILDYGDWRRPKKFLPVTSIHNDIAYCVSEPLFANILQSGRQYAEASQASTEKSFWTKSDATLVRGLVGLSNSLWRATSDNIKASTVHMLLSSSAGVIDQIRSSNLYGIVPIKADADTFNVKSLLENSNFLSQFQGMDESIDNLMTFSLGNDWKRAAAELTNEKATVAAIRQQVQRVRMVQNAKFNESGGIKRHYRILLNLIQQYYPQKTQIDLVEGKLPDGTPEEDIVRDRDGSPVGMMMPKEVPMDEDMVDVMNDDGKHEIVMPGHPKAKGKKSSRSFRAWSDLVMTEEEPQIYVEPGSTFAELKAIERAQELEFFQVISQVFGIQTQKGALVSEDGVKFIVEELIRKFDKDPEKVLGKTKDTEEEEPMPMPFEGFEVGQPNQQMTGGAAAQMFPQPQQLPNFQGTEGGNLAQQLTP